MGARIGEESFARAETYFNGSAEAPDSSYPLWVASILDSDAPVAVWADFFSFPEDRLREFFFGPSESTLQPEHLPLMASIDPVFRVVQMDFDTIQSVVELDVQMEVSSDLINWGLPRRIPEQTSEPDGEGWIQWQIRDGDFISDQEPRFYRNLISERY